jgi:hypothetical protein
MTADQLKDFSDNFGRVIRITRYEHSFDGPQGEHIGIVAECQSRRTGERSYWMVTTKKPLARCYIRVMDSIAVKFFEGEN